jgi:hypothetical protein
MLLNLAAVGPLPPNRSQLYEQATALLARETANAEWKNASPICPFSNAWPSRGDSPH